MAVGVPTDASDVNDPLTRNDFADGDSPGRVGATDVGFVGVCERSARPLLRDFDLAVSVSGRDAVVEGLGRITAVVRVVVGAAVTGPWSEAMGNEV